MKRRIVNGELKLVDEKTGSIRSIKLATDKQMEYIRQLEKDLKIRPKAYRGLTVWQAKKTIERLQKKQRPLL